MIFVTVGTHEQSFNRLVEYMDKWAETHDEEVIIQTGFSTYEPKYCKWQKLYPYNEMVEMVDKARIVITHGGPSSFIMPLQVGKIPIVVPRRKKYSEHINDHQVAFCRSVAEQQGNIILVYNVSKLNKIIERYDHLINKKKNEIKSNSKEFCDKFEDIVMGLFVEKNK